MILRGAEWLPSPKKVRSSSNATNSHRKSPNTLGNTSAPTAAPHEFPPVFGPSVIQTPSSRSDPDTRSRTVRWTDNGKAPPANGSWHLPEIPSTPHRWSDCRGLRWRIRSNSGRNRSRTRSIARLFQFLHPFRPFVPAAGLFHRFLADAEKCRTHGTSQCLRKPFNHAEDL